MREFTLEMYLTEWKETIQFAKGFEKEPEVILTGRYVFIPDEVIEAINLLLNGAVDEAHECMEKLEKCEKSLEAFSSGDVPEDVMDLVKASMTCAKVAYREGLKDNLPCRARAFRALMHAEEMLCKAGYPVFGAYQAFCNLFEDNPEE